MIPRTKEITDLHLLRITLVMFEYRDDARFVFMSRCPLLLRRFDGAFRIASKQAALVNCKAAHSIISKLF